MHLIQSLSGTKKWLQKLSIVRLKNQRRPLSMVPEGETPKPLSIYNDTFNRKLPPQVFLPDKIIYCGAKGDGVRSNFSLQVQPSLSHFPLSISIVICKVGATIKKKKDSKRELPAEMVSTEQRPPASWRCLPTLLTFPAQQPQLSPRTPRLGGDKTPVSPGCSAHTPSFPQPRGNHVLPAVAASSRRAAPPLPP